MDGEKCRKVVLAVDDVSMNLMILKNLLSPYFDVRAAKTGALALNILRGVNVDLILLDVEMPDMSGFEFLEIVKNMPENCSIPVIFVTSHADQKTADAAVRAGAQGCVSKPVDAEILKNKVFEILGRP